MNDKIKLIIEYQNNKSDYLFMKIVQSFHKLMKYEINKIDRVYQEDLYQEMLINLYNAINSFKVNENIKVELEQFNYENLLLIKELNYANINQIMHGKYFKGFVEMYDKVLFELAFSNDAKLQEFIYEYKLFCNENQLIAYLKSTFKYTRVSFYRNYLVKQNSKIINLNTPIKDNLELLDIIPDPSYSQDESILYFESLSKDDNEFLNLFLEKNKLLTEIEVGQKLGLSQQAVNKRKRKIISKLINKK